jgi:hypothetical protein
MVWDNRQRYTDDEWYVLETTADQTLLPIELAPRVADAMDAVHTAIKEADPNHVCSFKDQAAVIRGLAQLVNGKVTHFAWNQTSASDVWYTIYEDDEGEGRPPNINTDKERLGGFYLIKERESA